MSDAGICWLILVVWLSALMFVAYAAVCVAEDGGDRAGDR